MDPQNKEAKVHRGLFIAKERKKGKGGIIKSQSVDHKVQVFDDYELIHESEVQWVEVRRYDRNENKNANNKNNKNNKDKYKKKDKTPKKDTKQAVPDKKKLKYKLKEEKVQKQEEGQEKKEDQTQVSKEEQVRKQEQQDNSKLQQHHSQGQGQGQRRQQRKQEQGQKKQEIVIVGKITKQISNPFWSKKFVGILKFKQIQKNSNNKNKNKYKDKDKEQSHMKRVMDDYYFDVEPIHNRLPLLQIIRNPQAQQIFNQYIHDHIKIDYQQKGGAIRNKIMDQLQDVYVLMQYDRWQDGYLMGKLVKVIGKVRTIDGQCNCFLYEHGLNNFEHKYKQEKQVQINPTKHHRKLQRLVFTIDPPTSTDLDDALSIQQIGENVYEVGIHIADVTSYLHLLDREQIRKRTTSVYLPHTVFHMLPSHILKVCSLDPHVQRLAFSLFIPINMEGQVVGQTKIEKSVIKSRYKLSYDTVQSIITGKTNYQQFNQIHACSQHQFTELVQKLGKLTVIGIAHRKKRVIFEVFENRELKFTLDEHKWPIDCVIQNRFTAQKVVEQYMIIGNIEAAKKLMQFSKDNALIIHHPPPTALSIKYFKEFFEDIKIQFTFDNVLGLQEDLLKVSHKEDIPEEIKQLCFFKSRRMQETAGYKLFKQIMKEQKQIHFALGLQHYTHFTSPMRRMADIIVHEALNKIVMKEEPLKIDEEEIQLINGGRKNTKRLKRDLNQVYICLMMYKKKIKIPTQAIVVSYGKKSVSLYIPMFELLKEVMWSEMDIHHVDKNRKNEKNIDVCIHYDKKDSRRDIYWQVKKFQKIQVTLQYTDECPLRLAMDFKVKSKKGEQIINKY